MATNDNAQAFTNNLINLTDVDFASSNFKAVFEELVKESGYSFTSFINGILTTEQDYRNQAQQLSDKLRLIQNEEIKIGGEVFSGSIRYQFAGKNQQYDKYYNKSDKTGNGSPRLSV